MGGILFALLYFVGVFYLPDLPEESDSDEQVVQIYSDSNSRARIVASAFLTAASAPPFLWFLGNLFAVLKTATGEERPAARIAVLTSGVAYIVLVMAASAVLTFLAVGIAVGELPEQIDPAMARAFTQLGFALLLIFGMISALPLVLGTSMVALGGAVLPKWVAWFGFLVSPLLVLGAAYMPQLAVPLWVLVLSVFFLLRRRSEPDSNAATSA